MVEKQCAYFKFIKRIALITFIIVCFFIFTNTKAQNSDDMDNDGLSNDDEINIYFTDPINSDSDGDTYKDGEEIKNNYSPIFMYKKLIDVDFDKDGLNDLFELAIGTNLSKADTDGDGHSDSEEVLNGYDPLSEKNIKIEKLIKINLNDQSLDYYFDNKRMTGFKISGGVKRLPTPRGTFTILKKIPIKHYRGLGYNYPNTKWNMLFSWRGYYIHGAYWHNKFGTPMSHGCINVSYSDMEKLYNWTEIGTKVIVE